MNDYIKLRTIEDLDADDPDWLGGEEPFPVSESTRLASTHPHSASSEELLHEVLVRFRDANGVVVGDDDDPGEFLLQAVKRVGSPDGPILSGTPQIAMTGGQPLLLDGLRHGDEVAIRLTSITAPTGAAKADVYVRTGGSS